MWREPRGWRACQDHNQCTVKSLVRLWDSLQLQSSVLFQPLFDPCQTGTGRNVVLNPATTQSFWPTLVFPIVKQCWKVRPPDQYWCRHDEKNMPDPSHNLSHNTIILTLAMTQSFWLVSAFPIIKLCRVNSKYPSGCLGGWLNGCMIRENNKFERKMLLISCIFDDAWWCLCYPTPHQH